MPIKIILLFALIVTAETAYATRVKMCADSGDSLYFIRQHQSSTSDKDILSATPFCNQAISAFLIEKALDPRAAVKTANRIFALTSIDSQDATRSLQTDAACFLAEQGDLRWARVLSKERGRGMQLAKCLAKGGDFSEAGQRLLLLSSESDVPQCIGLGDKPFFSASSGVRPQFIDRFSKSLLDEKCAHSALELLVGLKSDGALIADVEATTERALSNPRPQVIYLAQTLIPFAKNPERLIELVSKCAMDGSQYCKSLLKRSAYIVDDAPLVTMPAFRRLPNEQVTEIVYTSDSNRVRSLNDEPIDKVWDAEIAALSFEDRRRLILHLMASADGEKKIQHITALGLMPLDADLRLLLASKFDLKSIDIKRNLFQQFAQGPSKSNLALLLESTSFANFPWTTHFILTNAMKSCNEEISQESKALEEKSVKVTNKQLAYQLERCLK